MTDKKIVRNVIQRQYRAIRPLLALVVATFAGCANVPKEVVELSYSMGQDMDAVHKSYTALIHDRFDAFRAERLEYYNEQWKPNFIAGWVQNGHLIEVANGQLIWSKADKKFVPPTAGQEKDQLVHSVQLWAQTALAKLDNKKKSLMDPLDTDEKSMVGQVDEAFSRLDRANATITAHLNSLRKVQDVQDDALKALKIKDLRDNLNQMIIKTSENAQHGLNDIKKADGFIDQVQESANKLREEAKDYVPK